MCVNILAGAALAATAASCAGKAKRPDGAASATTPTTSGASAAASPAPTAPAGPGHEVLPLVGTFQVHRYRLDNGLKLLVVEDHSSPTFAYQTWFRVGSRDEEVGKTGLAHLFEHLMFKGTKNLKEGEFDRTLEGAGAEGENAFTTRDYTVYVQELPSDKLELIARLEADRMNDLLVNDESFKTEREVVQNERRLRNENSPDGLMYQELFAQAFKAHPYRWPVIGFQTDLEQMTSGDALAFYKSHYSPNHATVLVIGDVRPGQVFDAVKKYYGALGRQDSPVRTLDAEPAQASPRRKTLRLNIQVEKLLVGYHIPDATSDVMPTIDVMQTILSGGKSSRLDRALVDTGIASAVESYDLEDKDPSLFVVGVNLQKGKKAAHAEAAILKELARLAREPVTEAELKKVKNRLDFEFYEGLSNNNGRARFLGHYESITGGFEEGLKAYQKIRDVTAAQVQDVARRFLQANTRTVITGVPK